MPETTADSHSSVRGVRYPQWFLRLWVARHPLLGGQPLRRHAKTGRWSEGTDEYTTQTHERLSRSGRGLERETVYQERPNHWNEGLERASPHCFGTFSAVPLCRCQLMPIKQVEAPAAFGL